MLPRSSIRWLACEGGLLTPVVNAYSGAVREALPRLCEIRLPPALRTLRRGAPLARPQCCGRPPHARV